jgi:hypothetical protein
VEGIDLAKLVYNSVTCLEGQRMNTNNSECRCSGVPPDYKPVVLALQPTCKLQESTHQPRQTHTYLRDFRLPLRRKWGLRSSVTLRSVDLYLVTDVSGQPIGPIFKGQTVQEEGRPQIYDSPSFVLNGRNKPRFLIFEQIITNKRNHGADICMNFSFSGIYSNLLSRSTDQVSQSVVKY